MTRCPLVLKLNRVEKGVIWSGTLIYKGQKKILHKPSDVGNAISHGLYFTFLSNTLNEKVCTLAQNNIKRCAVLYSSECLGGRGEGNQPGDDLSRDQIQ